LRAEPLREACMEERPVPFGSMAGATFRWSPRRLGMALARYKQAAKMLSGLRTVAEIGCADGFCSRVVSQEVKQLCLHDVDQEWVAQARVVAADFADSVARINIVEERLPSLFDGVYLLDVLEHISPDDEQRAFENIRYSLRDHGVCVVGSPSLESQQYARALSREGHVNCKTGDELRTFLEGHFHRVFMFGMNDEVLHTGFLPMCHYLLALCVSPIRSPVSTARKLGDPIASVPMWKGDLR
jgi:hypothetical protein